MKRITVKDLKTLSDYMNKRFSYMLPNKDDVYAIDQAYGGYRLVIRHANTGESDVSPRGTARETETYMRAMINAFNMAERHFK